ncbi:YjiG family protein [uncultured Phascolarctobacterium sp.]|uniref:YjiG family protein n=1 Tax=uncultured Phascolarctobacterium sp. TaxID=512296 RepID=UPI0025E4E2AD|nr:YjiG family protein [uncultured Phascolarctobacterium sp.]
MSEHQQDKKNIIDLFIEGCRKGWNTGISNMMPNVIMAFVIIKALNVTGLLKLLGTVFAPVMALWGLPGEAVTVLVSALMSMGGGIGAAAGLLSSNILNAKDVTVVMPAIYLMGSLVQYLGRCLGTAEVKSKYYGIMVCIAVLNALCAMWVMKVLVAMF